LVHAEISGAVLNEHVELLERALVHQQVEAFAGGELATRVLRLDAPLAAAGPRAGAPPFEIFLNVFHAGGSAGKAPPCMRKQERASRPWMMQSQVRSNT